MENKIKEIQEYFMNKIISWDFENIENIFQNTLSIKIDSRYFTFWCSDLSFCQDSDFWNKNFMDLEIWKENLKKIKNIFEEKWILQNKLDYQKEKDLQEFERIKKLYTL